MIPSPTRCKTLALPVSNRRSLGTCVDGGVGPGHGGGGRCACMRQADSMSARVGVSCRFTAIRGQGSRLNGEKIQVGEQGTLLESLVAAGKALALPGFRVMGGRSVQQALNMGGQVDSLILHDNTWICF